jgi:glutathione S-transferase
MPRDGQLRECPAIVGRSSSHFTRITRIFAIELAVVCDFEVVSDLLSVKVDDYAGNPALRLPILRTRQGVWFGALNICRELARLSRLERVVIWPEHLTHPLTANTQELVLQGMATEVQLILGKRGAVEGHVHYAKLRHSLINTMSWLETNAPQALETLPARDLSFLEVSLFCFITHLEFREVLSISDYPSLLVLRDRLAERPSFANTTFHVDV